MTPEADLNELPYYGSNSENKVLTVEVLGIYRDSSPYPEANSYSCSSVTNSADDVRAVLGCNANNANPSARTANCNNAASNSNDNYCSAAALKIFGRTIIARSKWTNVSEELGDKDGQASHSESNGQREAENVCKLLAELSKANACRRLNNMKKFVCSRYIIGKALDKMLQGKPHIEGTEFYRNKEAQIIADNRDIVIEAVKKDLEEETYTCGSHQPKFIRARWKGGKNRNAMVLSCYDQIVQIAILMVCEKRFSNEITRHIYSNIKGRSLLSNDPKFSLKEQLAKFVRNHPSDYLLMDDVEKFYESLSSKIAFGKVLEIVECPFLRRLYAEILLSLPYLPIGDSLSPMIANLVMSDVDKLILEKFKPKFFAAFGDNRIYGGSKDTLLRIREFASIYYSSRYNLKMKDDWSIVPTTSEFTFCKMKFKPGFTHVRASIRSHAMKVAYINKRFAGYKGMFMKTDGQSLLRRYRETKGELRSRTGQRIPEFAGKKVEMDKLVGKNLYLANYRKIDNDKPSEYYYRFMFIDKDTKEVVQTSNGSALIKDAMEQIESMEEPYKSVIHIKRVNGGGFCFEEFVVTTEEVADVLIKELGFN